MSAPFRHPHRVSYAECTLGNHVYHSRYLDWLEATRGEFIRSLGSTVLQWQERDVIFPVIEARLRYKSPARYDDLLEMKTVLSLAGKASFRFDMSVDQAHGGAPVASGYTVHAITDAAGKPMRCPAWLTQALEAARTPVGAAGVVA